MAENKTERVQILMTRAQKAQILAKAQEEGLSIGEYMRQQTLESAEWLEEAAAKLATSAEAALHTLDQTLANLEKWKEQAPRLEREAKRQALEELRDLDPDWTAKELARLDAAPERKAS